MKFTIYQAPFALTARGFNPEAPYEPVWNGSIDSDRWVEAFGNDADNSLEAIFVSFQRVDENHKPPLGYRGRSLSVGDIILLDGWAAYAVELVGFRAVDWQPEEVAQR